MSLRSVVSPLLLALALVWATSAHADAPSGPARRAFSDGTALFEAGKLEDALVQFKKALELTSSPNARLYVGRCLKDLGRLAEAYRELALTMREAAEQAEADPKYIKTRDAAAALVAILEPKIGKLVIALADDDRDATVTLDGRRLGNDELGAAIAVEPGKRGLSATSSGKQSLDKQVEVAAGQTVTVTLDLLRAGESSPTTHEAGATGQTGPTDDTAVKAPSGGGVRIGGYFVLAVGAAGMVTFGVAGKMVLDKKDELEEQCGGTNCPDDSFMDTIDAGRRMQIIANVGLGVGIGGIVAGGAMIAFGGPDDDASARVSTPPAARLRVAPFSACVEGRF